MSNIFDQFDPPQPAVAPKNIFDQFDPPTAQPNTPNAAPTGESAAPTHLQDALGTPGARFLKGAVVDPALGTMGAIESTAGHVVAPLLDPVGTLSDIAGTFAPNTAVSNTLAAAHHADTSAVSDASSGLNRAVDAARVATGRNAGIDPYQVFGAIASMALPMPSSGARAAAELPDAISRLPAVIDSTPDVARQALGYVNRLASGAGMTPDRIAAAAAPATGRGMIGAEAIGPSGVQAAATLARRSGTTPGVIATTLAARQQAAPDRMLADFEAASGINPEGSQGNIDALVDNGRALVKPLFDAALSTPGGIMTPDLAELMQRPIIKKSLAQAANDLRNDGRDPGVIGLNFDENGVPTTISHPTAEAWDLAKKALGNSVERDAFGNPLPSSKSPGNFNIGNANRALSSALSDAIPGYGDALKQSGDYLSLKTAFERGQKAILNSGVTSQQVADHVASLSPAERDAYKSGVANKIFNQAQNGRFTPTFAKTPSVQAKLVAVLGEAPARAFISNLTTEGGLARSANRMMPGVGSITSDIGLATGEQDHAANLMTGLEALRGIGHAATGNVLGAARSGFNVASRLGAFARTPGMSEGLRNAAGNLLMLPPEDLAEFLRNAPIDHGNFVDQASRLAPWAGKNAAIASGATTVGQ